MAMILPEKVVELWTFRAVEQRFPSAVIWAPTGSGAARWDQAIGSGGGKSWLFELKAPASTRAGATPQIVIDRHQLWEYLDRRDWSARWAAHLQDGGSLRTYTGFANEPTMPFEVRSRFNERIDDCDVTSYPHPSPKHPCWKEHCRTAWETIAEMAPEARSRLLDTLWHQENLLEVIYVLPAPPWGHVPHDPLPSEGDPTVRDAFPTFAWTINARDLAAAIDLDWGPYSRPPTQARSSRVTHKISGLPRAERLDVFLRSIEDCTSGGRFGIDRRYEQTGTIASEPLPTGRTLMVLVPQP